MANDVSTTDNGSSVADGGVEPLSAYMSAYTAAVQDEEVLLAGRVSVPVSPPEIIPGDLVRDEGRWKEVDSVEPPGGGSGTYVYFIEGTVGFGRLEYRGLQETLVRRRLSEAPDDAG